MVWGHALPKLLWVQHALNSKKIAKYIFIYQNVFKIIKFFKIVYTPTLIKKKSSASQNCPFVCFLTVVKNIPVLKTSQEDWKIK